MTSRIMVSIIIVCYGVLQCVLCRCRCCMAGSECVAVCIAVCVVLRFVLQHCWLCRDAGQIDLRNRCRCCRACWMAVVWLCRCRVGVTLSSYMYLYVCTYIPLYTITNSCKKLSRLQAKIPKACGYCNFLQHTTTHCNIQHHSATHT